MNSIHVIVITLLSGTVLQTADEVNAQAHSTDALDLRDSARSRAQQRAQLANTPEARAKKVADLDVWLRRMAGQFRITGDIMNSGYLFCERYPPGKCGAPPGPPPMTFHGVGDCVGVGAGAGVHCLFNAGWVVPRSPVMPLIWDPWLDPGIMLFGVDPDSLGIRYLQVDYWSIAQESVLGELKGDVVTFKFRSFPYSRSATTAFTNRTPCRGEVCWIMRISAPADDKIVNMSILVNGSNEIWVRYDFKLERLPQGQDLSQVREEMRVKRR